MGVRAPGDIIEDRGSQITFSALAQAAPPEAKYAWDPDGSKKRKLRDYAAARLADLEVRGGGRPPSTSPARASTRRTGSVA
jgi:hypothetical protein